MSADGDVAPVGRVRTQLDPHADAREIVRLFQCSQCSYLIRQPITLPCGASICRPCLPPTYIRENITYPQNAARAQAFRCPAKECGQVHPLADCSLDVTLNKISELVKDQVIRGITHELASPLLLDEQIDLGKVVDSGIDIMPRSRVLPGGRLLATFTLANMGELDYSSGIQYSLTDADRADGSEPLDVAVAVNLMNAVRAELECQVCYGLMLDPLTTPCGHTFCRNCVARVLDHSNLCPACRRPLLLRPGVTSEPSNKRMLGLIQGLFAEEMIARAEAVRLEEAIDEEQMLPLFVCSMAYPQMPMFLHIFEPRYRLMVRRCMENGTRKFGMLKHNPRKVPQGDLGRVPFMQYGTLLDIQTMQMYADGRSIIETCGVSRFQVIEVAVQDDYFVGRVQRIDDIPLAEEEAIEAQETSRPLPEDPTDDQVVDHMSTQDMLQLGLGIIGQARAQSADWLHERILAGQGQPPTDPATFPYWVASVLPVSEDLKYLLLPTTSVRTRLKMCVRWLRHFDVARSAIAIAIANRITQLPRGSNDERSETEMTPTERRSLPSVRGAASEESQPSPARLEQSTSSSQHVEDSEISD